MSITPEFLETLRSRLTLSNIVGQKVKLVKRGREHTGLCPFHGEKTPSFTVNDEKEFYHCFGCGAHGDGIKFLQETEGLNFRESVERLAEQVGLEVPKATRQQVEQQKKRAGLSDVMAMAQDYFRESLRADAGQMARQYLTGRGLNGEIANRFGIGFAPDDRNGLINYLVAKDVDKPLMIEAGLVITPDDGRPSYDRFRNRIMFPIHNAKGQVIAFGGRAMDPNARAKYLNSPETPLFHKGHVLYNAHRARESAHQSAEVIAVEGYMDVIALAQAGISNAVAPLGTALTEDQIALLWRMADEPILCFDGDNAGMRAAYRAVDRGLPVLSPGKSLRFALLPEGQDPDDLIRAGGATQMRTVLSKAQGLADMLWQRETAGKPIDTPERRAKLSADIDKCVGTIRDDTVRNFYNTEFRQRIRDYVRGKPEGQSRTGQFGYRASYGGKRAYGRFNELKVTHRATDEGSSVKRERIIVGLAVAYPAAASSIFRDFQAAYLRDPLCFDLHEALVEEFSTDEVLQRADVLVRLGQFHGPALKLVLGPGEESLRARWPLAIYGPDDDLVADCLLHYLHLQRLEALKEELEIASEEFGAQMDEETRDRFYAVQKEVETQELLIREEVSVLGEKVEKFHANAKEKTGNEKEPELDVSTVL